MKIIFTNHARYRLERRKILEEEAVNESNILTRYLKSMDYTIIKKDWIEEK